MAKIKYRLGLDLGANSLGWCVYRLDDRGEPVAIHRLGTRIFSDGRDPKTLASLASDRRMARQARRRRDRVLKRRHRLMEGLIQFGLMPPGEGERKLLQSCDPYELRARGLDESLSPFELGRAIYHLARKRGFKSSRKDRSGGEVEKETGKVNAAIAALRTRVAEAGCRTVGEYLARQHAERLPVRARRASDGQYVLYLQRAMVAEEFDALWSAQKPHHLQLLTDQAYDYLRDTMLFQRRLQPVRPGRCLFETERCRAPLCSPLQQRFRILQELNNLRIRDGIGQRPLSLEERNRMLALLSDEPGLVTFSRLAKAAGLRNATEFNLASEKRRGLRGDKTASSFAAATTFGAAWFGFDPYLREALALLVERAEDELALRSALMALPGNLGPAISLVRPHEHEIALLGALGRLPEALSEECAGAIARIRLDDDYGSLSLEALLRIVPELEREVVTYDVAVQRAGYAHHSQLQSGELFQRLPYYGEILRGYTAPADKAKDIGERRYGKIANPSVHVGLNQLRQLVNALIKRFGHPHEIVIELTREFGASGEKRREISKAQAENQARNEGYDAELNRLGVRANRENRLKLQLWGELGGNDALDPHCVYSGERLSKALLFTDEIEIDHILPFSRSLHDGIGNKVLCIRQFNREKGNRTPFEAFGHAERWDQIAERAARLPGRKALLFRENALEDFLADKNFLDRHLTDTAYLGRAAKQYLSYICPKDCVWVSSGKLTGMLRGKWGLSKLIWEDGKKNREDHRHHALDAAVIGLCDRRLIQRMATAARRAEERGDHRLLEGLDLPWASFREDLKQCLEKLLVSHKPDHGKEAALHNDTNYGWRGEPDKRGNPLVGHRVPLDSLVKARDAEAIADPLLRTEILSLFEACTSAKDIKRALIAYTGRTGVRRVLLEERLSVIPILDQRSGKPYRFVKGDGNYCYEIFRRSDGHWDGEFISLFEANQAHFNESRVVARNGLPLIMRIRKGDLLAVQLETTISILRVAKFSAGSIMLAGANEANVGARNRDTADSFKYVYLAPSRLRHVLARPVGVDILGYLNDPGFHE
jgi:CRISPR-associated endonuclease Csn1